MTRTSDSIGWACPRDRSHDIINDLKDAALWLAHLWLAYLRLAYRDCRVRRQGQSYGIVLQFGRCGFH